MSDEKKTAKSGIPSNALLSLRKALSGDVLTEKVDCNGVEVVIKTFSEADRVWASQFVNMSNAVAIGESIKVPLIVTSIVSIGGVPVEDLMKYPDDFDEATRKRHEESPLLQKYWRWGQLAEWLADNLDPESVLTLWMALDKLIDKKKEVIKSIPKS